MMKWVRHWNSLPRDVFDAPNMNELPEDYVDLVNSCNSLK